MTKRAKFLIAGIALALCAAVIWKLYQDAREPLVANQPLPSYVPDEAAKETIELWPAQQKDKWGYINRAGEFVIPPQFDGAWEFNEGLAAVQIGRDRKYGYINKSGQMVIQPRFTHQGFPDQFQEGITRIVSKPLRLLRLNLVSEKYGFIDHTGKTIIATRYDFAGNFHEGLARVNRRPIIPGRPKWGFINRKGELVIGYNFDFAGDFSEGVAWVNKDEAHFFIDATGKDVFGKRFEGARNFAEGLAAVQLNGVWGYINRSGVIVIPPQFKATNKFSEGLAAVQTMAGQWGFMNREGKTVIPPTYQSVSPFSEEVAAVKVNDRWGVIDKTGKLIIEPQFQGVFGVPQFKNGVAKVSVPINERLSVTAYIDKAGKIFWRADQP